MSEHACIFELSNLPASHRNTDLYAIRHMGVVTIVVGALEAAYWLRDTFGLSTYLHLVERLEAKPVHTNRDLGLRIYNIGTASKLLKAQS